MPANLKRLLNRIGKGGTEKKLKSCSQHKRKKLKGRGVGPFQLTTNGNPERTVRPPKRGLCN